MRTLDRALTNNNSFRPRGRTCAARLLTIPRNLVRSDYRKHRHEVEDIDGKYVDCLKLPPEHHSRLELEEVRVATMKQALQPARGSASR